MLYSWIVCMFSIFYKEKVVNDKVFFLCIVKKINFCGSYDVYLEFEFFVWICIFMVYGLIKKICVKFIFVDKYFVLVKYFFYEKYI